LTLVVSFVFFVVEEMTRAMQAVRIRRIALALGAMLLVPAVAGAHPLAPTLLDLRELGGGRIAVTWKVSRFGAPGANVVPVLPARCTAAGEPEVRVEADSVTRTWTAVCDPPADLVGEAVGFSGLGSAGIDGLVRVTLADGRLIRGVVRADTPLLRVPARERWVDVVHAYVTIGVEHILTGIDHLLFVAGLLLLVHGRRQLLETITAFTVGHSITLTLAVLDMVRVPSRPIELLIALSVFVLAVELAREPGAPPSLLRRRPWAMALAFGLLHGLGFAGALREVGLPPGDVPLALFSFNLGIEIGQLAFVAVVLAISAGLRALRIAWPPWMLRIPLYTMGSLAAFWCFERAAALVAG
jgi:hydrogenase/urease accessory protein HupE